jgi:GT2 family glycosyltransferase
MMGEQLNPLTQAARLPCVAEATGKLSIILVNFNGMPYLEGCLDSIRQFAPAEAEVILVDNASSDQSVAFVSQRFPWVQVERGQRNLGFSAGNNLGAKRASGDFLLLLNTDTVLLEPLQPALVWFQEHPEYGALTITMLDRDRISRACTGRFPTPLRLALIRSMLVRPDAYPLDKVYDVDWVQGSFMLMRAEIWRSLGGMDERYFMYFEDVELCKRIHDDGLKCGYFPMIAYLHIGGFDPTRFPVLIRNLCLYIHRHLSGLKKFLAWSILLLGCITRVAFYLLRAALARDSADMTLSRASGHAFQNVLTGMRVAPISRNGSEE